MNWTLVGVTTDFSFSAVRAPKRTGIMGSISPWHCRMAMSLFTPLFAACSEEGSAQEREYTAGNGASALSASLGKPQRAPDGKIPPSRALPMDTRGGGSARYLREGFVQREPAAERHDAGQLVLASESRVQRQGTTLRGGSSIRDPARIRSPSLPCIHPSPCHPSPLGGPQPSARCTSAPLTCEKPPRMMRFGGIPFFISCSIIALTGRRQRVGITGEQEGRRGGRKAPASIPVRERHPGTQCFPFPKASYCFLQLS